MEQLDKKTQKAFLAKTAQFRKFSGTANQTVDIDTSDIENLSNEEVNAIAGNVSHKIQLKQENES
ncbi:hypothetical protein ACUYPW_003247 [Vibrio vulnificus]